MDNEQTYGINIHASKPTTPGYGVVCKLDDPDANRFSISYPTAPYGMKLNVGDSLSKAEDIARAMMRCIEVGKTRKATEVRNVLEV